MKKLLMTLSVMLVAAVPAVVNAAPAEAMYIGSGWVASQGEWPWVAHLSTGCTGTLISPTRVLTAAHCVAVDGSEGKVAEPAGFTVQVNRADYNNTSVGAVAVVSSIVLHPQAYLPTQDGDAHQHHAFYDIAVLFLDRAVTGVPVAPIATSSSADTARVAGYGHYSWGMPPTEPIRSDSRLRMADFDFWNDTQCEARFNASPPHNHYDRTIHACLNNPPGLTVNQVDCITHGDSGGPMMINDGGWQLVGVTSYYPHGANDRCHAGGPFGFAWVAGAKMRDWPLSVQPPQTGGGGGNGGGNGGGGGGGGGAGGGGGGTTQPTLNLGMTRSAAYRHINRIIRKNTTVRPIKYVSDSCSRKSYRSYSCRLRFRVGGRIFIGKLRLWNTNEGGQVTMRYRFKGRRYHVKNQTGNYRRVRWGS